ncbi:PhoH family protein [Rubeoparvulum massiliense]|uniref:PhoH family protein n=1 Tax=Rubeoparvulum massiliense TaxID=1631346 RepID=UPI00065E7DE1|nr:PhoH family protein [Rubeoparvulum massiliense]
MQEQKNQIKISFDSVEEGQLVTGPQDQYLKLIEASTNAKIVSKGTEVMIEGEEKQCAVLDHLFRVLIQLVRQGSPLHPRDIQYAIRLAQHFEADQLLELFQDVILVTQKGKAIHPKSLGQRHYISIIKKKDIVFGIGPAGTGKTYLAVMMAVRALKENQVKRIVLTRPAVEAGESLGFLPGDMQEKVDPYLRPLYDALFDALGADHVARLMERGVIEVAPLAYMRGRTLEDCFAILDEAQNTTREQMKMFLTRLGFGSKMVITGDITQIDLPRGKASGLVEAIHLLQAIDEIGIIQFSAMDVVRHQLVQQIIDAYEAKPE